MGQTIEIAVSGAENASEDETAYLLQNPENRQRLLQALENARRVDLVTVEIDTQQYGPRVRVNPGEGISDGSYPVSVDRLPF